MATPTLEAYGKEDVITWYNEQPGIEWRLHRQYNTKSRDNIVNGSIEDSSKKDETERLISTLDSIDNPHNNGTYTLVVDNGKYPAQLYFKIKERGEVTEKISGITQTHTDPALLHLLNKQAEQLNELTSKINAMELEKEEEEKPSGIAGILTNEHYAPLMAHIAGKVVDILDGLAAKYTKPNTMNGINYNQPNGIAGVPDEADEIKKIESAIAVLMQYDSNLGEHLTKLAHMAQTETAKFNMLLKML